MNEKTKNRILPITFLVFIFSFALLLLFLPKNARSENEKRVLAKFPEINFESIKTGAFTSELEVYLSDHFPFRDLFVGIDSYKGLALLQNGENGVYKADGGYLITEPPEFDEGRVQKNAKYIEKFVKLNNVPTSVILVPTAGYTLNDKLPSNHKEYYDDEVFKIFKENIPSANFIDIRSTFKNNSDTQIYYRTDHHLTSEGSLLAYGEFCKATGNTEAKFSLKESISGFYGTTYSKSGLWLSKSDTVNIYTANSGNSYEVVIDDGDGEKSFNSLYFFEHKENLDKYPIFLDGNHPFVKITNQNVTNGKKLLIVKDSYAHCFTTFAIENYEEIVMIDLRYYKKSVKKLVAQEGITEALFMYGAENILTSSDLAFASM